LKGLLIVNGFLRMEKFDDLTYLFQRAAKYLSVELSVKKNSELPVCTGMNESENHSRIRFNVEMHPNFVLFWDKDVLLARWLEDMQIPVYNSARAIALCDDKRKMHLALERHHIPTPETMFAPMTYSGVGFTDISFLNQVSCLGYPLVVKEAYGSFGAQVYLAENREALERIVYGKKTTEFLFQKFIANSKGRDVRLQVVGDRVIAGMYRYSETDFRANITAGGSMRPYEPSAAECRLALQAARAVGADFAGVDLLFGEDGPIVCEVNSNAHFKNLMECTGADTAMEILSHIVSRESCRNRRYKGAIE
jgi:RimK family alpha-L-glutamate ligase